MMIAIKRLANFDRYGTVVIDDGIVSRFHEKEPVKEGFINGGIYLLNRQLKEILPDGQFSFEQDFMEKRVKDIRIGTFLSEGYFIDIGVPEDYRKACHDFKDM
jgi:D-glycero-alpha-D-manno-heptose 1-phosphate guanylyltransferase